MSSHDLHTALLRPAIIHILRASGFAGCKHTTLDAVTDLAGRYIATLAQHTAHYAYEKSCTYPDHPTTPRVSDGKPPLPLPTLDDAVPTITDVRAALAAVAFFSSGRTPVEEAWQEALRRPLSTYHPAARDKEKMRRDAEDTQDVREFIDWIQGPINQEIRRIAGVLPSEQDISLPNGEKIAKEDYLAALQKKQSKAADGSKYAGTVLGRSVEDRAGLKIDGGPGSLEEWQEVIRLKSRDYHSGQKRKHDQITGENGHASNDAAVNGNTGDEAIANDTSDHNTAAADIGEPA